MGLFKHRSFSITAPPNSERLLIGLAAAFVFANAISLSLVLDGRLDLERLSAPLAWLLLLIVVHWSLARLIPEHDPYLIPAVGLLTGWGLILQARLAPSFLHRQVEWLAFGLLFLTLCAIYPAIVQIIGRFKYTWLVSGLILLVATLFFGVNPSGQGARLWLPVPLLKDVFFQPSELLKPLLIVYLASYFDERFDDAGKRDSSRKKFLAHFGPLALMWGFSILLLIWQRDLGTATLFFIVFMVLLFLDTGQGYYFVIGGLLLALAGAIGYFTFDVVSLRVDSWWDPWPEATGRGFQIVQSIYAFASGGIVGQGIGQGYPTFVPVVHSDFIFAAIGEEWGLIGTLVVVTTYCLIIVRSFHIATGAKKPFHLYLAAGIGIVFGVQSLLIMAGVIKVLPLTGVTLAFVSYGGSSLMISAIMVGLLLNLSSLERRDRL